MTFIQYLYSIYLHILGLPCFCLLAILGWKRSRISANLKAMNLNPSRFLLLRFYRQVTVDLLRVIHGYYGRYIYMRLKDQGKIECLKFGPGLFLSAHFHNWELMGSWLIKTQKVPLLSMALPFKNPWANRALENIRSRLSIPYISDRIPRLALRHIRSQKVFGLLWDQYSDLGQTESIFFTIPVRMDPLPIFLSRQTMVPIFFGALLPSGQFRLVQIFHPKTFPKTISPTQLARRYNRVLEILVGAYPDYWYGLTHRRFKDQISY